MSLIANNACTLQEGPGGGGLQEHPAVPGVHEAEDAGDEKGRGEEGKVLGGFHLVRTHNFRDFRPPPSPSYAFHATYPSCCTQKLAISSTPPPPLDAYVLNGSPLRLKRVVPFLLKLGSTKGSRSRIEVNASSWIFALLCSQEILRPKMNLTVRFGKQFSESSPCLPGQQDWYASGTLRKVYKTYCTVHFGT